MAGVRSFGRRMARTAPQPRAMRGGADRVFSVGSSGAASTTIYNRMTPKTPSSLNRNFNRLAPQGTRRRRAAYGVGGAVGTGLVVNSVLGPRPPSAGRNGLRPGGSQLPY